MLSNPDKPVKMSSAAGINGKSVSKPFAKPNIQKGIYVTGVFFYSKIFLIKRKLYPPMSLSDLMVQ
jgi:hypothetical protein